MTSTHKAFVIINRHVYHAHNVVHLKTEKVENLKKKETEVAEAPSILVEVIGTKASCEIVNPLFAVY